jgi:hypothetical protein
MTSTTVTTPDAIQRWHHIAKQRDTQALDALLDDAVVFHSPVVHTPQVGKLITFKYLCAALQVLNNDSFTYINQWVGSHSAVLEFQSECEGILIDGIDIITWNEAGRIVEFKVMVRPLKAVNKLHELMGKLLLKI